MAKNCFLLLLVWLGVALPAQAWQLQTRVATSGGDMTGNGITQTSANGTVYKNYTDTVQPVIVITAASGYQISAVYVNSALQSPVPASPANYTMGMVVYPTKTTQSVIAYFAKETYPLTTAAGSGGTVSPLGTSQVQFGTSKTVTFSPLTGKNVVNIDGQPEGTVLKNAATGALVTLPAPLDTKVSATFTMPRHAVTLTGSFVSISASTDGPKTVLTNHPVTLTASSEPAGASFTWQQTGGPGYAPEANPPQPGIAASGAILTFTPTVPGSYFFKVTAISAAGAGTANTYVTVTDDAVTAAEDQCNKCHLSRNLGQAEMADWSGSAHAGSLVMCYNCHVGGHATPAPTETACAECHVPPPHGASISNCLTCHDAHSLAAAGGGTGCTFCHAYPPASGAHLAHFGLADVTGPYGDLQTLETRYPTATPETAPAVYAYGCGNCHSVDSTRHMNGMVDVLLYEAAAASGSLKALAAPDAAYDPANGTCNGVYCHSTGQATPGFRITPSWNAPEPLGCNGCHANPPAYPSGGAGAATANSHIGLADDGWTFGHFSGIRGPWHSPQHGNPYGWNEDSAPITCQTCHYETADPANVAPNGFYWLDTTGDYRYPGMVDPAEETRFLCGTCHKPDNPGGRPPVGVGRVLPLRHANGKRDVIFDRRETLPDLPWLPGAPNKPTRPMWFTGATSTSWAPDAAPVTLNGTTRSWSLANATYDPSTKTCFNTSCHVQYTAPVWGKPFRANDYSACCECHNYCY